MIGDLRESVIDEPRPELSQYVFHEEDGVYRLLPKVRFTILETWADATELAPIGEVLLVGSIATYNYTEESDVDITLHVLDEADGLDRVRQLAKNKSGKKFAGPHEINYFAKPDIQMKYYDSAYSVLGDKWIKGPARVSVDPTRYLDAFEEITKNIDARRAELISDIMEYRLIRELPEDQLRQVRDGAEKKLGEIEKQLTSLAKEYKKVKDMRNEAFQEAGPHELAKYGSYNALPENIIFLLLRRYCYVNFLADIRRLVRDDDPDLKDAVEAVDDFNTCQKRPSLDDKLSEKLSFAPGD